MPPSSIRDVRPSPIAGTWYPGDAKLLASSIDSMLDAVPHIALSGSPCGLIVPHAGHRYSGRIAACGFRQIQGLSFERVVVISPMHGFSEDQFLTTDHDAYATPLGAIPVDHAAVKAISEQVPIDRIRADSEHSLEIELPFLQRALVAEFRLIPLMLRDQSFEGAQAVGNALAAVLGTLEGTLLVASSDLSHFYPQPIANKLDHRMLDLIAAFDPYGVVSADTQGKAFACGHGAIASVLIAARTLGADRVEITGYGTSGDVTGDTSKVVGYGSAVITTSHLH